MGCCFGTKVEVLSDIEGSHEPNNENQHTSKTNSNRIRPLPQIENIPANNTTENQRSASSWSPVPPTSIPAPSEKEHFDQSNNPSGNIINVLLLGESGVGKSTFINAVVNYLTYDTLEEAHSKKPIAMMPVSFLMTVGDNFEEQMVSFGGKDQNENHNQVGQSVTQHCKSYMFDIGSRSKLRLIDTPGMGDTRGLDQDDINMQHIISFIDGLSHLNAICILLKPNESRLNIVIRSYFTQLIGFLGENVRNNIIFCFTNTRATFFAPGDTAPLLRKMLDDLAIKDIPFDKPNTFCFDSESFRYLMALENGIKFDKFQKEEYKQSWRSSVDESNRLLQYMCTELKSYPQKNWHSFEHAQYQINKMTRTMLETVRNILRNIIIATNHDPSTPHIELRLTPVPRSSTICNKCNRIPQQYGDFWILPDEVHIYSDNCSKCRCNRKWHVDIDYRLDYDLLDGANQQTIDEMSLNIQQLKQISLDFGYFFLCVTQKSEQHDPILSCLDQMIEEEKQISQEKGKTRLNTILHKRLNQFKEEYELKRSTLVTNGYPINLESIYKLIQIVNGMDIIRKQINVITTKF